MRPGARFHQCVAVAVAAVVLACSAAVRAQDVEETPPPPPPAKKRGIFTNEQLDQGFGMGFDLLVLRPLGFVGLAVGCALYIPAIIVTGWDADMRSEATELFVKAPAQNVFTRPLGDF